MQSTFIDLLHIIGWLKLIAEQNKKQSESRLPWPRQIMTSILPNVIMLSLGGERLTPKVLDHYLHHDLGMLRLLWCLFDHLLILKYLDHHQNLISSSLHYPGPFHIISSQSVYNFLSNVVHRQTNKQTDKPVVMSVCCVCCEVLCSCVRD